MRDPRQLRVISVLSLFEQQQERLPPALMADTVLAYDDLPWAATLSVQAQLKRMADLLVAALLLLLTAPFVLLAMLLIWLEDRGPLLYAQRRSGWLGRPFTVYKLRTMTVQPADAPVCWTQPGDQRITMVGGWLRRFRLDELPQLFNVLTGEMSLIGPRPERPELEKGLEENILHYRKRHWMRPGLSGWAQVCAPYASSIEDSDLKLSYDLYYLRHFSTWLDLVILLRTVKTCSRLAAAELPPLMVGLLNVVYGFRPRGYCRLFEISHGADQSLAQVNRARQPMAERRLTSSCFFAVPSGLL